MKVSLTITTTLNMHVVNCIRSVIEVSDMHEARHKFKEAMLNLVVAADNSISGIKGILFKDGDYPVTKIRESFAEAIAELIDEAVSPIMTAKVYYKSKIIRTFTLSVE